MPPLHPTPRDCALAFLYSRIDYERALAVDYGAQTFKLDRMRALLERLGNPQERLAIDEVAHSGVFRRQAGLGEVVTQVLNEQARD